MAKQIRHLTHCIAPDRQIIFGAPVAQRTNMSVGDASGVATCVTKPFFCHEEKQKQGQLYHTSRYLFSIIYTPSGTCFRCVVVYGYPCRSQDNKNKNIALFSEICDLLAFAHDMPTILVGDFNTNVHDQECFKPLFQSGWIDPLHVEGVNSIPTFRSINNNYTTIDYVLLNPLALAMFVSVNVDPILSIGHHAPIFLQFRIQKQFQCLRCPIPFSQITWTPELVSKCQQWDAWHRFGISLYEASWETQQANFSSALSNVCDLYAQGLYTFARAHKQSCSPIYRGAHQFSVATTSAFVVPSRNSGSDTEHPWCSKEAVTTLSKQLRRISELVIAIQQNRVSCAMGVLKALDRCPLTKPDFLSWFSKTTCVPLPVCDSNLDVSFWRFIYHQFEVWLKKFIHRQRKQHFKKTQAAAKADWLKGGRTLFSQIRESTTSGFTGATLEVAQINVTSLRIGRKTAVPVVTANVSGFCFQPIFVQNGKTLMPVSWRDQKVTFARNSLDSSIPISVHIATSNGTPLAQAFADMWRPFWQRTADNDSWQTLVTECSEFCLTPKAPCMMLSLDTWMRSVKSIKSISSPGSDFWRVTDLLALPVDFHIRVVQILNHMTATGSQWPAEYCNVIVSMIPKCSKPVGLSDFRPISLYPLLYRIWAKAMFRKLAPWLRKWVHPAVKGFLPGSSVSDIGLSTAFALELSHTLNTQLSGIITDITKCFDTIHWKPIYELLSHTNIDTFFLKTWFSHVCRQRRYFRVNHSFCHTINPTCGFGQGDPLSIIPTVLIGHCIACHIGNKFPTCSMAIYADNLSFQHDQCTVLPCLATQVWHFLGQWQLQVDQKKSVLWATDTRDRKWLREHLSGPLHGMQVLNSVKDLGTHLAFDRSFHATVTRNRLDSTLLRLDRLTALKLPTVVKERLILQGIFSHMFFGAALHFYSEDRLDTLSTAVVKALGINGHGRSVQAVFAICKPELDPRYFVHRLRIVTIRKLFLDCHGAHYLPLWTESLRQPQGPFKLFLQSTAWFGWSPEASFLTFSYAGWCFSLLRIPTQMLFGLLRMRFEDKLTTHFRNDRKQDIDLTINISSTKSALDSFSYQDTRLLHTLMSLVRFTGYDRKHWSPTDEHCKFCQRVDTWNHRCSDCSLAHKMQSKFCFNQLPLCNFTKYRGWGMHHSYRSDLFSYLQSIPEPVVPFSNTEHRFLYIDGTACPSGHKGFQFAAASIFEPLTGWEFSFPIPGYVQTSDRAELYALFAALQCAGAATIHTDCKYVFFGFISLLRHCGLTDFHFAHVDIWSDILTIVVAKGPSSFFIKKVKAHSWQGDYASQRAWHSYSNHVADTLAKIGNLKRETNILHMWRCHSSWTSAQNSLIKSAMGHMLQVFRTFEQANKMHRGNCNIDDIVTTQNAGNSSSSNCVSVINTSVAGPEHFRRVVMPDLQRIYPAFLFGSVYACKLLSYLAILEWPISDVAKLSSTHIACGDLLLDFIFSTGVHPPVKHVTGSVEGAVTYVIPSNQQESQGFSSMLYCFMDSVHVLSHIAGHEMLPGLSSSLKRHFVQLATGGRPYHRFLPYGPSRLICPGEVAAFKFRLSNDVPFAEAFVEDHLFLSTECTRIADLFQAADLPPYDCYAWRRARINLVDRDRKQGIRRPKHFEAAIFDNG